jgi:hypothetical protein
MPDIFRVVLGVADSLSFMRRLVVLACVLALLPLIARAADSTAPPLYALIVAGGPDEDDNAAQIEGHAKFVSQILPPGARRIVLFADGKTNGAKICYVSKTPDAVARQALSVLLPKNDDLSKPDLRALQLDVALDGPAETKPIHRAIGKLAAEAAARPAPILLFFAGHGSPASGTLTPAYDLWNDGELDVHQLARELTRVPPSAPVVLVMAQCFSGAFGNVLFEGGDAKGALARPHLAGFFSAAPDREASGCSWETGQADYQDFSSYFFGALTGRDRFGNPVTGADFDGDGRVTLHEAYCYAMIHDISIDTPGSTSEVYLAQHVHLKDEKVFAVPYPQVSAEASPAQRAALEALSQRLGVASDQRMEDVADRLAFADPIARDFQLDAENAATKQLNDLRLATLHSLFKDWPALGWADSDGYAAAVTGATKALAANPALCANILDADRASDAAEGAVDNEEADLLRFRHLYAAVVRAADLKQHGSKIEQAQFEELWQAEQATLPLVAVPAAK